MNSLIAFKLKHISRRRFLFQLVFWLVILTGLGGAHFIYQFLFSNNFTQTEPLSLFDVIQITGIIALVFAVIRSRSKTAAIERRLQDLHQELSIRLSVDETKK